MCTVVAPRKRGDIRFVREMESQIIKIFFLPPAKLVETDTRAQKRNIYIRVVGLVKNSLSTNEVAKKSLERIS